MRKKFKLVVLLAILSLLLTGCAFLNNSKDKEVEYPVGIITPKPTLDFDDDMDDPTSTPEMEISEAPTPETSPSITPAVTPDDMDDDIPTTPIGENKIIVSNVTATEAPGGLSVNVEGKYPDSCTKGNYSWSVSGTQIIIDLGILDETIAECGSSDRAYSADIPINYSLQPGQEYTVLVNEVESDPIVISL